MAYVDDLITQVRDAQLRQALAAEVARLKDRTSFGLVFERHIPETAAIPRLPLKPGSVVVPRVGAEDSSYLVVDLDRNAATIRNQRTGEERRVARTDLLVVENFGGPIFPALTSVGSVERGGDKPFHAVVNGENYHALQLFQYLFGGSVDCIYIDPPYNTGARDWRYNNDYIDANDFWRHSKWLSFMDKRLRLAKQLLKPDGVLIVTVDEHELHHLGMVVEEIFRSPQFLRYVVTIVNNPKGTYKSNFGRVDEQAIFVVPNVGYDVINPRPASEESNEPATDPHVAATHDLIRRLVELSGRELTALLSQGGPLDSVQVETLETALEPSLEEEMEFDLESGDDGSDSPTSTDIEGSDYENLFLRRRGQESSHRESRPNQFYAILVDEAKREVVGIGPPPRSQRSLWDQQGRRRPYGLSN